jgi:alanine dehydrogenase
MASALQNMKEAAMNVGVLLESRGSEKRVALTPPVVRSLVEGGSSLWIQSGAGEAAMYPDDEYRRAGARIAYSAAEVIHRCELILKISVPSLEELDLCQSEQVVMAFYHMAVEDRSLFQRLLDRRVNAVGYEVIRTDDGRLPVLAAVSEIAGQMTLPLAAHLLRRSAGGRGILLGGSSATPPAHVVVLGAGVVGSWAARAATAAGARVSVLDIDADKLRRLREQAPAIATGLAESESVAQAVISADVVIGAVLVAGSRTPHVVTQEMVRGMKPGSVIIDVAIDQGGCVETSRPTTLENPTFVAEGVTHYCVPNLTSDMSRSASVGIAHALLPYVAQIADNGLERALKDCPALARSLYTYHGECVSRELSLIQHCVWRPLSEPLVDAEAAIPVT